MGAWLGRRFLEPQEDQVDKAEAERILATELAIFRERPYKDLVAMIDSPKRTVEVIAPSGTRYCLDVLIYWDGDRGANVRVIGTIDDGGFRAFVPLSDDFIKAPDGSLVGEE
jgi:hypothetical protein